MKLSGVEAARYFARPDPARAGLLIFGADAMRVALRRQEVILALIGPEGEGEMRLTRMQAADLRRDTTLLGDAMRASSFFPGPRVVFLEDATDTLAPVVAAALKSWQAGDAYVVVTAGALKTTGALAKAFEAARNAVVIGIYDDPPSRDEIEGVLARTGLTNIDRAAMSDILILARDLDPGDFRQTMEKLALYKRGDETPLSVADVAECAPATIEADVDDVLLAVADGREPDVARLMRRLTGQGVLPVTLCIGALRHFRTLHAVAVSPDALNRVRGKGRDAMARQAREWGVNRLEAALRILIETDLTLRSTSRAPAMAVMERSLIRLAMLRK
jgi:DNA polymerase-3 subunit delta